MAFVDNAARLQAIKWRPYQAEALDATERLFGEQGCNPLVVIPTGGGKGPLSGEIARRFIARTGKRVITATHVKELVDQNFKQARRVAPDISTGIFSASLGRKDRFGQVTVANVQSIARHAETFRNVGLLIIDEAHLLAHGDDGQYHELIKGLQKNDPRLQVVGLTATPWRTNSGNLTEPYKGIQPLFNEVAYEIGIAELVGDGYLTRMIARRTNILQNTAGVKSRMGEYAVGELDKAVNQDPLNEAITEEVLATAYDRKAIIEFCVSVDHAQRVAETYRRRGVEAVFVDGDLDGRIRDRNIAAFKSGRARVITNCGVLTTGFDHPAVDCIVHRRPTMSPGLYLQICGRGTRVVYADGYDLDTREGRLAAIAAGGKPDCLMLDFAGNVKKHGLIDAVKGVHKRMKKNDEDLVECQECHAYCSVDDTHCHACGAELPKKPGVGGAPSDKEAKLSKQNFADAAMSEGLQEFPVLGMRYGRHQGKNGKPDTFKLSFSVPGEPWPISEWLCLDHEGWPQKKARQQWRKFSDAGRPPQSVEEAISRAEGGELKYPSRIWARRDGQFWRVEGYSFA
ncbi:MAG TPA: DEAD/DEAH box helicase [Hyphomicrobium sp.]|nr:DEAD/DEAH box helicase [Hyphomicrobium sp.]